MQNPVFETTAKRVTLIGEDGSPDTNLAAAQAGVLGGSTLNTGRVAAASPAAKLPGIPAQRGITLMNTDASTVVYIGNNAGVNASNGFPLAPNGSNIPLDYSGDVYLFAASGSPSVAYVRTAN